MEYHIRYTCSGELQEQIVDFITRNAQKYIVSREFASREHIQCYVVTNVVKKTWVNKFNAKFKNMDRRDKYVELDKGNTKLYVCKGLNSSTLPDVVAMLGFNEDDKIKFHSEYWANNTEIVSDKVIEVPLITETKEAVKKVKTKPFMAQVRDALDEEYPDKEWDKPDKRIVFRKVMFMLGRQCKSLDHIIISRMVNGVLNSLIKDKESWLEYWYEKAFGEELNPHEDFSLDE